MTISIRPSRPDDYPRTFEIWRGAVVATHDFLTPEDFAAIERMVRDQYLPAAEFWIAADENDQALAFMGMSGAQSTRSSFTRRRAAVASAGGSSSTQ